MTLHAPKTPLLFIKQPLPLTKTRTQHTTQKEEIHETQQNDNLENCHEYRGHLVDI